MAVEEVTMRSVTNILCSYSHEDRELKSNLEQHLSPLIIARGITPVWSDGELLPGDDFNRIIRREIDDADIILLLISASYFSSNYCWYIEAARARERAANSDAVTVVPVLLRPVKWDITEIAKFLILPRNQVAVTKWPNQDEAFEHIATELDRLILLAIKESCAEKGTLSGLKSSMVGSTNSEAIFHCVPQFHVRPVALRGHGVTELLPDLVLHFKGECQSHRMVDIDLSANTNITSQIVDLDNRSEALLSVASGQCLTLLPTLGRSIRAVQTGVNRLTFLRVPLHELHALSPPERNLRISNVRVNANLIGFSESAAVHVYVRVTDVTVHPAANLLLATTDGVFRATIQPGDPSIDLKNLPNHDP